MGSTTHDARGNAILTPLENLLTWALTDLHDTVGLTWAWSIVALVVIVRMLIVPLTVRQIHSMQNLQAHVPEMKAIQQRWKHDQPRMNAELMQFYKDNQINPASSCLPILLQIPIFIGLFFVLRDFEDEIWAPYRPPRDGRRPRVARPRHDHRGHERRLGPAAHRRVRRQPAHVDLAHVDDDAAGTARADADPADRVHPVRAQLPGGADGLLADDEPVDDRPGLDHPQARAKAGAAAEEELAYAAEAGRPGADPSKMTAASHEEAGRRRRQRSRAAAARPQGEAQEGRRAPLTVDVG